jgi:hypothetical protein
MWLTVAAISVPLAVVISLVILRVSGATDSAERAPTAGSDATSASSGKKPDKSTTTTTTPPHPMNPEPVAYDVPGDITNDCSVDVTAKLLAWIDATPDNSVLQLGTNACYEIEGVLYVANRKQLTFTGNGAHFVAKTDGRDQQPPAGVTDTRWPRRRAHWWIADSTDITVTNVTVTGANPFSGLADNQYNAKFEVQSGFVITRSTNVTLSSNTIEKVWGDFVTVEANSSNVAIDGNHMTTDGRQGIAVTDAQHVIIDGNTMDDMRRSVFDLEANFDTDVVDDVRIVNNTTGNSRLLWLANAGKSTRISNITIEKNTMTGTSLSLLYSKNPDPSAGKRGPWTIVANNFRMHATDWAGFEWIGSDGISLHDNVVTLTPDASVTMVRASSSDHLEVHDNDFTGTAVLLDPGNTATWCESNNLPAAVSKNRPC